MKKLAAGWDTSTAARRRTPASAQPPIRHDSCGNNCRDGDSPNDQTLRVAKRIVEPVVGPQVHRAQAVVDHEVQPLVAVVNATFADLAFPGESAIGRRFVKADGASDQGPEYEVVGVVENAKYQTVTEAPQPFVYVPFAQQPATSVQMFVRRASAAPVAREIRAAVGSVDRYLPVAVHSFEQHMREEFTGLLAPLIGASIPDLQPSFEQFADGLRRLAEGRAR